MSGSECSVGLGLRDFATSLRTQVICHHSEDLWSMSEGVTVLQLSHGAGASIQGIGISGEGHTCFVQVDAGKPTLGEILRSILRLKSERRGEPKKAPVFVKEAERLLQLGSVWLIESAQRVELAYSIARLRTYQAHRHHEGGASHSKKRSRNPRPRRATEFDLLYTDWEGVTLRVHHEPILFEEVNKYNWGAKFCCSSPHDITVVVRGVRQVSDIDTSFYSKPGVVLYEDERQGYMIVVKPSGVPVHAFAYNGVENVAHQIQQAKMGSLGDGVYISIPQRLDNGTSGVLLLATTPTFASYACKLMKTKTESHISHRPSRPVADSGLSKKYKCLVCIMENPIARLSGLAKSGATVTHYLSPTRSVAGVFVDRPSSQAFASDWKECRLRIISTSTKRIENTVAPTQGSAEADLLAINLWGRSGRETVASLGCTAVVQVEVDLLTGRTHQIRGQLSAMGFPLVGDSLYGGGTGDRLALHCCELSFPDPDIVLETRKGKEKMVLRPSKYLNSFRCEAAWWDEFI